MKKQFLLSMTANVVRMIFGFVFFWQVSQALDLGPLGDYLYLIAALGYFGTIIDYGFNLFVLNTASRSEVSARPLLVRIMMSKLVLIGVSTAILLGTYSFAFASQGALVTALFFLGLILQSFSGLLLHFYKALGRFDYEFWSTMLNSILPVALLFVIQGEMTLFGLAILVLAVRGGVLALQAVFFWSITKSQSWSDPQTKTRRLLATAKTDLSGNFKYAVFAIFGALFLSIDLVIMRFVLGAEDVSIYGTAMKAIMAIILFFEVLTGVFVPRLAKLHSLGAPQFRTNVLRFAGIMLMGALSMSGLLLVFGDDAVLFAFGAEFAQSGAVLQVLSAALVFRVMTMVSGSLLTVYGGQGMRAKIMTFILPVHIVMNIVLQGQLGIWGAVYSLIASFLLLFLMNLFFLWRGFIANPS